MTAHATCDKAAAMLGMIHQSNPVDMVITRVNVDSGRIAMLVGSTPKFLMGLRIISRA